jgi:hypothetical protein
VLAPGDKLKVKNVLSCVAFNVIFDFLTNPSLCPSQSLSRIQIVGDICLKCRAILDFVQVMILSQDKDRGRISLSTKKLEPTPGDMLRNPALVYEKAEEMAKTFRQRVAQAEAAAKTEELRLHQEVNLILPPMFDCLCSS